MGIVLVIFRVLWAAKFWATVGAGKEIWRQAGNSELTFVKGLLPLKNRTIDGNGLRMGFLGFSLLKN